MAVLGQAAFDEGGLRELLQSETVLKIIYDCRTDADALYHLCATKLTNVCDCQVLCAFYRDKQLAIERSLGGGTAQEAAQHTSGQKPSSPAWAEHSRCARASRPRRERRSQRSRRPQPLVPEYGGSYESWRQRPLSPALLEYAAADVAHLHTLRASWSHLCTEERMSEVTSERIERTIMAETMARARTWPNAIWLRGRTMTRGDAQMGDWSLTTAEIDAARRGRRSFRSVTPPPPASHVRMFASRRSSARRWLQMQTHTTTPFRSTRPQIPVALGMHTKLPLSDSFKHEVLLPPYGKSLVMACVGQERPTPRLGVWL